MLYCAEPQEGAAGHVTLYVCCCSESENIFFAFFQHVFRPSLKAFDLLIHLRSKHLSRRHLAVDPTSAPGTSTLPPLPHPSHMPVVDFDPVTVYLWELEVCARVRVRLCLCVHCHILVFFLSMSAGVIF